MKRLGLTAAGLIAGTLVVASVILYPWVFPRYVEIPDGLRDRWTGDECTTLVLGLERRNSAVGDVCTFEPEADRPSLLRPSGGEWEVME